MEEIRETWFLRQNEALRGKRAETAQEAEGEVYEGSAARAAINVASRQQQIKTITQLLRHFQASKWVGGNLKKLV